VGRCLRIIEIAIGAAMLSPRTVKARTGRLVHLGCRHLPVRRRVRHGSHRPHVAPCRRTRRRVLLHPARRDGVAQGREGSKSRPDRVPIPRRGRGIFGGTGALLVWAAIWIFEAIIWMFPANRTGNAVTNQMSATAVGEPGWYAHLLNSFGHAFTGCRGVGGGALAATSIVIALGPLVSNRPQLFIGLGIAVALGYWVTGQGLGELLTFGGTDPSNGPIVALIGLSVLPLVPARASEPTPAARLMSLHPVGAVSALLGLALVPLAVAVTPAGTQVLMSRLLRPRPTASSGTSLASSANSGMLHVRHVDGPTPSKDTAKNGADRIR
jgi:hypothetical protein